MFVEMMEEERNACKRNINGDGEDKWKWRAL